MLANEKTVALLLRFLKATEVGVREGARETEAEWIRKNDQAGKNRHGAVRMYLSRIGVIEAPNCCWCKEVLQSVEHLYIKYRKWRRKWRNLVRKLEEKRVI